VRQGMLAQWIARLQTGSDVQKALFVMVVGVLGVFAVLAIFFGLIHLLRVVMREKEKKS
jgi:hypothetical protein